MNGYRARSAVLFVTAVFCLASIVWVDRPLALYLSRNVSDGVYRFFRLVTEIGRAEYLCGVGVVIGAVFLWRYYRQQKQCAFSLRVVRTVVFMLACQLVSAAVVHALKFACGRYRPSRLIRDDLYGFVPFGGGNSFPSGHTQAIVAALLPVALCWPRLRVPAVLVIVLVIASRVVMTAHFLSDVMASAVLTTLCVIAVRDWFVARGWLDAPVGMVRSGERG